jgi:hypothetical protein
VKEILDLFKDFRIEKGFKYPILKGRLPQEIIDEIDYLVEQCNKIKTHPLAFLREHKNYGKNTYQISVPSLFLENSFIFAFITYMGEYFIHSEKNISFPELRRSISVRKIENHFDGYDFWLNYSNIGDSNPRHNHSGLLSGVIYVKNDSQEKTIFEDGFEYCGDKGDIIMFPSEYFHQVNEKTNDIERITIAFNLQANV